eukprot:Gb_27524 [translate_table: standard]
MELETIGMRYEAFNGRSNIRTLVLAMVLLHLISMDLTEAMLSPQDFLALQSIRKGLRDMAGSTFFGSWDFSKDPCSFSGVTCSSGGEPQRVVALNLGNAIAGSAGLRGKLDGAVGLLTSLTEFTIVPGQVVGSIPETLGQLKELQFLGISKNFVSGMIPQSLGALKNLQILDLGFNQLVGSIPQGIGQLPKLSKLILSRNKLTGPIPALNVAPLIYLDLRQNSLSGPLPSLPSSLEYIFLAKNHLNGGIEKVGGLQQLAYIDLSFNRFTGSVPSALFGYHITSLQLQRNSLSGTIQPMGEVNIPTVDLSYNLLSGNISPLLASVQTLYLSSNQFTGPVPLELVDHLLSGDIHTLYLHHNYLTEFPIQPSATIPSGGSLCIQYNCMVSPVQSICPSRVGRQKMRPKYQCKT